MLAPHLPPKAASPQLTMCAQAMQCLIIPAWSRWPEAYNTLTPRANITAPRTLSAGCAPARHPLGRYRVQGSLHRACARCSPVQEAVRRQVWATDDVCACPQTSSTSAVSWRCLPTRFCVSLPICYAEKQAYGATTQLDKFSGAYMRAVPVLHPYRSASAVQETTSAFRSACEGDLPSGTLHSSGMTMATTI